MLEIYTDGASSPNTHKAGGWGVVFVREDEITLELSGGALNTTNNIMEMTAVLEAMKTLHKYKKGIDKLQKITIISDSQYTLNGITTWRKGWEERGWKNSEGKPVKNKELWKEMFKVRDSVSSLPLHFKWVKGHSGNKFNDVADELAVNEKHKIAEENNL